MQNEEWNVSAVSLSPELVRLAQQKQARLDACLQAAENGNEAAITELGINYFYGINGVPGRPGRRILLAQPDLAGECGQAAASLGPAM